MESYFRWAEKNLLGEKLTKTPAGDDLQNTIHQKLNARISDYENRKVVRLRWIPAAAAASVMLAVTVAALLRNKPAQISWLTLQNKTGQAQLRYLPDSSKVWLNSGTTLSYISGFEGNSRDMVLEGEAYFEVIRNENKPFIVRSQGIHTKVLGTRFNVKAYPQMSRVAVTVISGKVGVEKDGEKQSTVFLKANQQAIFDKTSKALGRSKDLNAGEQIAWQSGRLVFFDAPLQEVLLAISNKYGQTIQAPEQFKRCRIYFEFSDEQFAETLSLLEKLTESKIEDVDGTYRLNGKGCQ